MPPTPSEIAPCEGGWNPANLDLTHSVCVEGVADVLMEERQETLQESGWTCYTSCE